MARVPATANEFAPQPGQTGGSICAHRKPYEPPRIFRLRITCIANGLPSPPDPPYPFRPPDRGP